MKYISFILISPVVLFFACSQSNKNNNSVSPQLADTVLAQRPPMGWNSWNCYGVTVNEQQVKANADYMAQNLKQHGWEYVVVDLAWFLPPTFNTATFKLQNPPQNVDGFGRLIPDTLKFPSASQGRGFKPLADYIHSLGLKFGIHIMRGLPWQAVRNNLAIKGSSATCNQISLPGDTCVWYDGLMGVNTKVTGGQEYYNSIVELYASWGVDFIKADDMGFPYHTDEIEALSNAIDHSGRPIVLSLSPGAAPIEQASHLKMHANLWRISPDFWDHWSFLKRQFELCRQWQSVATPGHWPDADMLPLGKLRVTGPDDYVAKNMGLTMEEITNEYSRFTTDEKYTLMSLWSIFRSPLMMGGNLPENDSLTLKLLTNDEVLQVNQYSFNNKEIRSDNGLVVWSADALDGSKLVACFNTNDDKQSFIPVSLKVLGIDGEKNLRDLWKQQELGKVHNDFVADVPAHGAKMFKIY